MGRQVLPVMVMGILLVSKPEYLPCIFQTGTATTTAYSVVDTEMIIIYEYFNDFGKLCCRGRYCLRIILQSQSGDRIIVGSFQHFIQEVFSNAINPGAADNGITRHELSYVFLSCIFGFGKDSFRIHVIEFVIGHIRYVGKDIIGRYLNELR